MILYNCKAEDFIKSSSKKIICFGATLTTGKVVVEQFEKYGICDRILFFVDNDSAKWGKKITIGQEQFEIFPVDHLNSVNPNEILVFIVSRFWEEILIQLNKLKQMENVPCFCYFIMGMNMSIHLDEFEEGNALFIPPVIHYCWFGENKMGSEAEKCIASWKKYAPDFEIKLWNESNYNVNAIGFLQRAYRNRLWAFVSDYVRCDVVYKYGGVYFDTDVELIRPINSLLKQKAFFGMEPGGQSVNTGVGFGAEAGSWIVKENLDEYNKLDEEKIEFKDKEGNWNREVLAPVLTTRVLLRHGLVLCDKLQRIRDVMVYPSSYFSPSLQIPEKNTFSIHKCSSYWSFPGKNMQETWERQKQFYLRLIEENKINQVRNGKNV